MSYALRTCTAELGAPLSLHLLRFFSAATRLQSSAPFCNAFAVCDVRSCTTSQLQDDSGSTIMGRQTFNCIRVAKLDSYAFKIRGCTMLPTLTGYFEKIIKQNDDDTGMPKILMGAGPRLYFYFLAPGCSGSNLARLYLGPPCTCS